MVLTHNITSNQAIAYLYKQMTIENNTMNEIKIGSIIPQFALLDQNGNLFDINSVLSKKNLVIYFYPKDDTPG
jgi:peroxiredoxin Q/BCP